MQLLGQDYKVATSLDYNLNNKVEIQSGPYPVEDWTKRHEGFWFFEMSHIIFSSATHI
jgi:hypothetical protein